MNAKKIAAEKAVEKIENDMIVGLGTGSTAYWAIVKIGERIKEGLRIKAVASSVRSENLAKEAGIEIIPFNKINNIDLTIDGADEVDGEKNLIKGGGGALLREKILAFNSKQVYIIIDDSKFSDKLGKFPLPVEIIPFASNLTLNKLKDLKCNAVIRQLDNKLYKTDNGNLIADCDFYEIADPEGLNSRIHLIPGVVETGLFPGAMVTSVIIGYENEKIDIL
ncbi:MAG TPA: ribose-5-phosphate isomerase RpiA [Flavisolibacter sp.]|jgi:ribose 5-phosphate isomerase A|nr:ribose-5-phosphate isomerase RpiA [Flavisolibacter sp.]